MVVKPNHGAALARRARNGRALQQEPALGGDWRVALSLRRAMHLEAVVGRRQLCDAEPLEAGAAFSSGPTSNVRVEGFSICPDSHSSINLH